MAVADKSLSVVFPSKVDSWLAVALVGSAVVSIGAVVAVAVAASPLAGLALLPIVLLSAGLPLWILRSTHYTMDRTQLHIQSGPFRWKVPLRDIRSVTPTRNPLSSPALSLARLRIEYGRMQSIMISPEDKDAFLAELDRRRTSEN